MRPLFVCLPIGFSDSKYFLKAHKYNVTIIMEKEKVLALLIILTSVQRDPDNNQDETRRDVL